MAVIHSGRVSSGLLLVNTVVLCIYMVWWLNPAHVGNPLLYGLLFAGEIYHAVMALTFWHTLWPGKAKKLKKVLIEDLHESELAVDVHISRLLVDVYITVAGEPVEIVAETVRGAKRMDYGNKKIYILNDSFVAKKSNWEDFEKLAKAEGVHCITRKTPGGAKAGNINHALAQTRGDIVVIFDADMVPHQDFLAKVIPYFDDPKVGFVQTPQFYNNNEINQITGGAWEQQELFFGAIMRGKEKSNASFICGTNVAIRKRALEEVGGMNEKNIAEDFLTSLAIHQKGWKSYYVSEVLAEGLAPEDLLSYYKQQQRWARGSLEVLFSANPLFKRGLTWRQKTEYISSALYYLNGLIVLIDIAMPIIYLFTGVQAVSATTTSFAILFIPFIALNLLTLYVASDGFFTFRAAAFSISSWTVQLTALFSVLTGKKMGFAVTPKQAQTGNYLFLAYPHLAYALIFAVALFVGVQREGINPSIMTNISWGIFNIMMFLPFIYAATERTKEA